MPQVIVRKHQGPLPQLETCQNTHPVDTQCNEDMPLNFLFDHFSKIVQSSCMCFVSVLFLYFLQVHSYMPQFLLFFTAWQQTHCSVPAHGYFLNLSKIHWYILNNFNLSMHVCIVSTVIAKTPPLNAQSLCKQYYHNSSYHSN